MVRTMIFKTTTLGPARSGTLSPYNFRLFPIALEEFGSVCKRAFLHSSLVGFIRNPLLTFHFSIVFFQRIFFLLR